MFRILVLFLFIPLAVQAEFRSQAFHTSALGHSHVENQIMINWKNIPASGAWVVPGTAVELNRVQTIGIDAWELWGIPAGTTVDQILNTVKASPDVKEAGTNQFRYTMGRVPDDPLLLNQKHLDLISAYAGWEFGVGQSTPTTIAIIDTGVDISHVDLSSAGANPKIWTNPVDLAGGGDQDGNGFANDLNGWNFGDGDNDVSDCAGHGTLVASVAGASGNNGVGVSGVSWGAKILPLRVFPSGSCDSATSAAIAAAIRYAVWAATSAQTGSYTGRTVINMSLGCLATQCAADPGEQAAVNLALDNGILVVAAKGNFGNSVTVHPADYPGVMAVGATNNSELLASFSSTGAGVDLVAPGVDVFGAARGGGYRDDDGTSFSSPQVAGAAALIMSVLPTATTTQVEAFLLNSADDLGSSGRDNSFGYGRLNLFKAMRQVRFGASAAASFDGTVEAIAVPNPFMVSNASRVLFTFPNGVSAGTNPKVEIYDITGLMLRKVDGFSWDGRNDQGAQVAPGVYIFKVKTDKGNAKGRVIVGAN